MAVRFQVSDMESLTIWEQHTATLSKDPRRGFGIAISGGRDRSSDSVVVSDVVPGGPAEGRLQTGDHIVMVNGVSVENVTSTFAIQILKTCSKLANITVKRPRKVQLPATKASLPGPGRQESDEEDGHGRGYEGGSSSGSGRSWGERSRKPKAGRRSRAGSHGRRSPSGSEANGLALVSGYKRLPRQDVLMKPVTSVLVKRRNSEEFGVKLGSQIYIKHITDSGLAARNRGLQEGDLILQINGVSSENLSLSDTRRLIEKSEGKLTLLVLRDRGQFLVNIPPAVSDSDSDSSFLDDISDLNSELSQAPPPHIPPPPRQRQRTMVASPKDSPDESPQHCQERSVDSRTISEPDSPRESNYDIYRVPSRQSLEDRGYSPDTRVVRFPKGSHIGLRLAGGNDVGIFVSGVQPGSPADGQGIQEGDEILQVNDTPFRNLTREEAVQFLMGLPTGEVIELVTQRKQDIFKKMVQSRVGDSFYIRTHFELEASPPSGLGFTRGDVFHVVDTLYPGAGQSHGRGGYWLAARMGRDLREQERGVIPNRSRAEQLASLEAAQRAAGLGPGSSAGSNARAEFWRLRGLRRGAKKTTQQSREDLSVLTKQGHYPPYERVVLREASFKRPVVILGPVADIAMQKLTVEMPDQFEIAESVLRTDSPSKIIKLDTVRVIAEKDKHALLDVTPSAIERLNYVQYYPIVIFCRPESRSALKALREWLAPASRRSARRLYGQAQKLQKHNGHLFTATVLLHGTSDAWYQEVKAVIREQQTRPIWTAEDQLDGSLEDNLDLPRCDLADSNADLSCDSRANSDYEETDGEGGVYTDGEGGPHTDVDEGPPAPALARSSEPVQVEEPQSPRDHGRIPVQRETQVDSRHHQAQWRQDSMRTYEREALRRKFTRARDVESSDEEGYDWGPATDL
ncbi:tight junction protein ZO-3 isoform X2 [Perognathus longimembris pacificus]|uniref:tight junction protein ZO-3 isoform X2 n=1 Tax=Perognathus longimembris pacificus TaxID=214514 RepID=UPI00201893A0|nr:tight junction protein ZO-3 isoform X2 [Perognathus longimembris pacificus]